MKYVGDEKISKSEAAKRLGVSPSMISKYVRKYSMPLNSDGSVSWEAVQKWHAATIEPSRSGSYMHRYCRDRGSEPPDRRASPQTAVDLANAVNAPDALLSFTENLMLRFGLTPQQAHAATLFHSDEIFQAVRDRDYLGVDSDPTRAEWIAVLGDVDLEGFEESYDLRASIEDSK